MTITDEAVEAAAKASWEKANSDPWISGDHDDERWADRRIYLDDARVMLEAAAPFIAAQAWDEGMNDAWNNSETMQVSLQALRAMNPYREAAR